MDENVRQEIQKLSNDIASLETKVDGMADRLKPILKEFNDAAKDLIRLQDEQKRIKDVNIEDVVENVMAKQYRNTYEDNIRDMVRDMIESFHANIRWKALGVGLVVISGSVGVVASVLGMFQ